VHLDLGLMLETFNKLVDLAHFLDPLGVLLLRLFDLEIDFSSSQILLILFNQPFLLCLNGLLLSDGEVIASLAFDLINTLVTMSLDKLDHAVKDCCGSLHFLLILINTRQIN
jgi:hypothetical protein